MCYNRTIRGSVVDYVFLCCPPWREAVVGRGTAGTLSVVYQP